MTSGRLWSLVAVLAAPLVIAATLGCDKIIGIKQHPVAENKLTCHCRCDPVGAEPGTTVRVVASSDDAEQIGALMNLGSSTLNLGENLVGLRFANLKIPQRASVLSAVVRFTADNSDAVATDLRISAEASATPATFTTADDDLGSRTFGSALDWTAVPPWATGNSASAQETPELSSLLQPLVNRTDWTDTSALVLRIDGVVGVRRASSFDDGAPRAALLEVTYTTGVHAKLPICASPDVEHDGNSRITLDGLTEECGRVERTLEGLAGSCGYPPECACTPVTESGDVGVCAETCVEVPLDDTCSNFDPNAFQRCMQAMGTIASCKHLVAATNAPGDPPVCVPSGSALAFHAFGTRSRCEVAGTSHIRVGDREPEQDPRTTGFVELLGRPCPEGGCQVHPYFELRMDPITFSVRWASDPTFRDLIAVGRGLDSAAYGGGEITYAPDGAEGSGNGWRRRIVNGVLIETSLAVESRNAEPLDFGIDWTTRACDMVGSIAGAVGDDGVCTGDDSVACFADAPDCDAVGGPCILPDETDPMDVTVFLEGDLVNQPPTAAAGPDQSVECTSTGGASFALDGRGSSDPDGNLALASWRQGTRTGPLVANGYTADVTLALGESWSYVLRVVDSFAQTDDDVTQVSVVDTTPPEVVCNAPATLPPPNRPVTFTATATDTCTEAVVPELVSFECFRFDARGRKIDKTRTCKVVLDGGTITIAPPQGVGRHIAWTAQAVDGSGNVGEVVCEVEIVRPR